MRTYLPARYISKLLATLSFGVFYFAASSVWANVSDPEPEVGRTDGQRAPVGVVTSSRGESPDEFASPVVSKEKQDELNTRESVEKFRKDNPDLSTLCDACLAHSPDIQFLMKLTNNFGRTDYTNFNPFILSACKVPPFDAPHAPTIVTTKSALLTLTDPNLEPTYPTIEKRPPVFLLPAKARYSAALQSRNGVGNVEVRKSNSRNYENKMLLNMVRNYADKLNSSYEDYRAALSRFSSCLGSKPPGDERKRAALQLLNARLCLVGLCGEDSVSKVDEHINALKLIKIANNCQN